MRCSGLHSNPENFSSSVCLFCGHLSGFFKFPKHEDQIGSSMRKMKMLEEPSQLQYHKRGDQR